MMTKKSFIVFTTAIALYAVLFNYITTHLTKIPFLKHAPPALVEAGMVVIGIISAIVFFFIQTRQFKEAGKESTGGAGGGGAATAEAPAEVTDLDELIGEAEARLAVAEQQKDTKISQLPMIMLIGETGSAKTSVMVHSNTEPESLAGQVYEENHILPTPTANIWFAHHTVFLEMSGKLLGDNGAFEKVIHRLEPPHTAALLGTAEEMPRAILVCVDAESLTIPSPDPLAVSARKLRVQLTEISRLLGINLPVYVLFTRTDRLPYFTEYVSKMNNDEATRIIGATLPVVTTRDGIYAEQETARVGAAFEKLFRSLCNARPTYLSREADAGPLASVYEFPREFRKVHQSLVRFLVELCRPSQLTVGPFLRGFYFSGVRPIVVNEVAPSAPVESPAAAGRLGATGMFRYGAAAQPAGAAPRIIGTRKVPQWLFLSHFFNDLLLADSTAKSASTSSIRASLPRRILLASAASLCLIYSMVLLVSFRNNRKLASDVKLAAEGIASVDTSGQAVASLDSLQKLETLRQSLEVLTQYNREGAPLSYKWGLYIGNELYPDVRRLYFADFGKLLLTPTQNIMVDFMHTLPGTPTGPEYGYTYDTLKAYLETTSNHDKTTRVFLPPVLLGRWSANRNVDPQRLQLAQKQFEFYSDELKIANPLSSENDADAIGKARFYLNLFKGLERVYQAMLTEAAKTGPVLNFNKKFPGSAEEVIDTQDVAAPFTKPGWDFMKAALKNPEKYYAGEPWVLGEQVNQAIEDRSKLAQQLADRYYSDYIKAWRAYLKAARVVGYTGVPDAAKKLQVTSGNQSPLLELFWLCSANIPSEQPEIANAFQPVQTVMQGSSDGRYISASNQGYMTSLVNLQAALDSAAQQTPVTDAAAAATVTNASAAKVAARQVAQVFRVDAEAHVDQTVQNLMEDPITYAQGVIGRIGPDELNKAGSGMCAIYQPLMNKFPFTPTAKADATIAEFNGVFHPGDGVLWKLYNEKLTKLLVKQGTNYVPQPGGGITLTPSFVTFFNNAAKFADWAYQGNSADPHFTYTLKTAPSDGVTAGTLQLDGQSFPYDISTPSSKQFTWTASGTHGATATAKTLNADWFTEQDLWAVFKFFNKAETFTPQGNGARLEWFIRVGTGKPATIAGTDKPITMRFDLDMMGGPEVFQKGYFSRLACIARVAQ